MCQPCREYFITGPTQNVECAQAQDCLSTALDSHMCACTQVVLTHQCITVQMKTCLTDTGVCRLMHV